MKIRIADIHVDNEFNCRGKIAPIDVADLRNDIERHGLLQPILVSEYSPAEQDLYKARYRLVAGFRRTFTCRTLNWEEIEAVVRPHMSIQEAAILNLNENLQRSNLDIVQEAKALERLRNLGLSNQSIAEATGQSYGWTQIRTMLLALPPEIHDEVKAGIITQSNIRELYTVLSKEGKDGCLASARKLKEDKQAGRKSAVVRSRKAEENSKRHRKREEIFTMQQHVRENIGNGFGTRCLAWAAGEISTGDLIMDLRERTAKSGKVYVQIAEVPMDRVGAGAEND